MQDKGTGKLVPEKVGLKSIQRDGVILRVYPVFDLDIHHFASCSKDRTGIFMDKELFIISENTGKQIADWCTIICELNQVPH